MATNISTIVITFSTANGSNNMEDYNTFNFVEIYPAVDMPLDIMFNFEGNGLPRFLESV